MNRRRDFLANSLLLAGAAGVAVSGLRPGAAGPCTPDGQSLCLGGSRFRVTAFWSSNGDSGAGHPVGVSTKSGYFWFSQPDNIEVFVKVLANCPASGGGYYAVYVNGLTHEGVTVLVTDTQTGNTHQYENPPGSRFQLSYDAGTFRQCP